MASTCPWGHLKKTICRYDRHCTSMSLIIRCTNPSSPIMAPYQCVIEHLRGTGTTSTIALWGRSMGAATALLHGERDPSIAGMILDSSFADLTMLAEEMVEKGRQHGLFAPNFLVSIAIRMIRGSVQKAADFDIRELSPIEKADKCFIPALFVAAEGDDFVPPHHR
jgi:acetyl esterase/lipase